MARIHVSMSFMVAVRTCGLVPYLEGLELQDQAAREVRGGTIDGVLLAIRHPPVITLGRRTCPGDVFVERWARRAMGVELFHVDRGGGATFHYPGQAVVYPVLNLRRLGLCVPTLLAAIAEAVHELVAGRGALPGYWDPARPGYYIGGAKVASVGLHVAGDVTTHGVALNVASGYDGFGLIAPCRERGLRVTSLCDCLGIAQDPDEIAVELAQGIQRRIPEKSPRYLEVDT